MTKYEKNGAHHIFDPDGPNYTNLIQALMVSGVIKHPEQLRDGLTFSEMQLFVCLVIDNWRRMIIFYILILRPMRERI